MITDILTRLLQLEGGELLPAEDLAGSLEQCLGQKGCGLERREMAVRIQKAEIKEVPRVIMTDPLWRSGGKETSRLRVCRYNPQDGESKEIRKRTTVNCSQVRSRLQVLGAQSCLTLCNPIDCSLPGPLSMGFSWQEY